MRAAIDLGRGLADLLSELVALADGLPRKVVRLALEAGAVLAEFVGEALKRTH